MTARRKEPSDKQIQDRLKMRDAANARGDRLEGAAHNLRYVLWIFRRRANLHWNSEDEDLIAALERGEKIVERPGAEDVLAALYALEAETENAMQDELLRDRDEGEDGGVSYRDPFADAFDRTGTDEGFARLIRMRTGRRATTVRPKALN